MPQEAQRASIGVVPLILTLCVKTGWVGKRHNPNALFQERTAALTAEEDG
jgi:hypothetical protein